MTAMLVTGLSTFSGSYDQCTAKTGHSIRGDEIRPSAERKSLRSHTGSDFGGMRIRWAASQSNGRHAPGFHIHGGLQPTRRPFGPNHRSDYGHIISGRATIRDSSREAQPVDAPHSWASMKLFRDCGKFFLNQRFEITN